MEFGLGSYDTALFYHEHPYDSGSYHLVSVRSLYEELEALNKNRTPKEDIIYEEGWQGQVVINVGKMIERREQQWEEAEKLYFSGDNSALQRIHPVFKNDYYELLRTRDEENPLVFMEKEPGELTRFLKSSVDAGNDYVAYDPTKPISTNELRCFELYVDAQDFCNEARISHNYVFTSIDQMQIELKHSTNINSLEQIVGNLQSRMIRADWYYDYSDDHHVRRQGEKEFRSIMDGLEYLSKQPNGKELVRNLWDKYGTNRVMNHPEFLREAYSKQTSEKIQGNPQNQIKRPNFLKQKSSHKQKRKFRL
jgi:hypothetical protein